MVESQQLPMPFSPASWLRKRSAALLLDKEQLAAREAAAPRVAALLPLPLVAVTAPTPPVTGGGGQRSPLAHPGMLPSLRVAGRG